MLSESDLIELFNERAAICEFCGGLKRADAEWLAYMEVKKLAGRTKEGNAIPLPAEIVKIVKIAKEQKFLF
jgi:hypothetical protein